MAWPVEIQVSVIGAAFAVAGYTLKSVIDWWQNRRKEQARTIAQLQRLQSLLNASREVFDMQQDQVKRLTKLLEKNHPAEFRSGGGFEETMSRYHSIFNDEEKEIHSIIRAYTEHSLRPVNLAMSEWLRSDELFKTGVVDSRRKRRLADNLIALEVHLLLWHAKYEVWIPDQPQHALVYMVDEQEHGLGFPGDREIEVDGVKTKVDGLDTDVRRVLEELRRE